MKFTLFLFVVLGFSTATIIEWNQCDEGYIKVNGLCKVNNLVQLPHKEYFSIGQDSTYVGAFSWGYRYENGLVYVEMGFDLPTTGWVGWAIGSSMIPSTDMWIFEVNPTTSTMTVKDGFSNAHFPSYDIQNGGTEDIEFLSFRRTATSTTVQFRRLQNTKDKNDQVLKQGIYNTIFAYGGNTDYAAKYHGSNRGNYVWTLVADCPAPSILINNICTVVQEQSIVTKSFNIINYLAELIQ